MARFGFARMDSRQRRNGRKPEFGVKTTDADH
jgi:hypothetical protein